MLDKDTLHHQLISRRTFIIAAGKIGLLFLLAGRMFYMQFMKRDEYKTLSDKNRISIIILPPVRGKIYDQKGILLAKNSTCFRLLLDKNSNSKYEDEVKLVADILHLDSEQMIEIEKRISNAKRRVPTIIIDDLDWEQIATIEERKPEISALFIDTGYVRHYPSGHHNAHVIGYMGKNNDSVMGKRVELDKNFKLGQSGIEKYYNDFLQGQFGHRQIELNAYGHFVRSLGSSDSIQGQDLLLNIDSDLQMYIMSILDHKGTSVVVMDCTDGSVVALNSSPVFEPNNFNKLSNKYWNNLVTNPYKPLINKTIQALYPPGSVFKIITMFAALEAGILPEERHFCSASASATGDGKFRCANKSGHGSLNMIQAIKYSCNSYVYAIARKIGADKIIETARLFGFGEKTMIDLPGELAGFVPDRNWKKRKLNVEWTIGDSLNLCIGQGFFLCTPIQLARMISAVASKGKLFVPKVAKASSEFTTINIKKDYFDIIHEGLFQCVNTIGGTGYYGKLSSDTVFMSGKTGTAQVQAKKNTQDDLSRTGVAWHKRNHGIFTGFAPHSDPKYAVSIYYDHGGGGGGAAAPIAKRIMNKLLL